MLKQNNLAESTTELGFPKEVGVPLTREVTLEDGTNVKIEGATPEVLAIALNSHYVTPGEKYVDNGKDLNGVVQNFNNDSTPTSIISGLDTTITFKDKIPDEYFTEYITDMTAAIEESAPMYDYHDLYQEDIDWSDDYEDDPELTPEEKARIKEHKEGFEALMEQYGSIVNEAMDSYAFKISEAAHTSKSISLTELGSLAAVVDKTYYLYLNDDLLPIVTFILTKMLQYSFDNTNYTTEGWYNLVIDEKVGGFALEKYENSVSITLEKIVSTKGNYTFNGVPNRAVFNELGECIESIEADETQEKYIQLNCTGLAEYMNYGNFYFTADSGYKLVDFGESSIALYDYDNEFLHNNCQVLLVPNGKDDFKIKLNYDGGGDYTFTVDLTEAENQEITVDMSGHLSEFDVEVVTGIEVYTQPDK